MDVLFLNFILDRNLMDILILPAQQNPLHQLRILQIK